MGYSLYALLCLTATAALAQTTPQDTPENPEVEPPPSGITTWKSEPHNATCVATADSEEPEHHAQRHIDQARLHFAKGEYEQSIMQLGAGLAIQPRPILLFNIAQSYRRWGKKQEAVDYFQRFIAAEPSHRHASEARTIVQELTTLLNKEAALDLERRRPIWKRPWFWGVLGTSAVVTAVAIGLGVGLNRPVPDTDLGFQPVQFELRY